MALYMVYFGFKARAGSLDMFQLSMFRVLNWKAQFNGSCSQRPILLLRRPWKLAAYFLASPRLEVYLSPNMLVFVSEVSALNGRKQPK